MSNNLNRADDDNLPHYPSGPGHRGGATSKAGAIKVHRDGSAKTQSSMILRQVEDAGANGNTAAEAYAALADDVPDVHVVRARISSLVREGKLADSGRTRDGGCGVQVKVWVAARFAPPKDDDGQADMFASAAPAPARDRPRLTIRKPKGITGLLAGYAFKAA